MDDPDIAHSCMSIKEMVHFGYELNEFQSCDIANNSDILTGKRSYFKQYGLPRLHVPKFQPKVLSRVPQVERSRLIFPLNIADFLFKDGVQVMSGREVEQLLRTNLQHGEPDLSKYPHLSATGATFSHQNKIKKEMAFTS